MNTSIQTPSDLPYPEYFEMALEDELGHPITGEPHERVAALERRLQVLREGKLSVMDMFAAGRPDAEALLDDINKDIARAKEILADWRLQAGASN